MVHFVPPSINLSISSTREHGDTDFPFKSVLSRWYKKICDSPVQSVSSVVHWIFCWIRWYNEVLNSKPRVRQIRKNALAALYLALSRSISLCAIFVPYLCTRNAPLPAHPLNTHPSSLTATLSPLNNRPSYTPAEVQHATQSIFYILCKQNFSI